MVGHALAGISHQCSGALTWRRHSCLPRRHSCRRLLSTLCHAREQVSRRVSTRQARVPAPHRRAECEKCGLASCLLQESTTAVGQAILPAGCPLGRFQPAGPAGKRVRSLDRLPHIGPAGLSGITTDTTLACQSERSPDSSHSFSAPSASLRLSQRLSVSAVNTHVCIVPALPSRGRFY
jgi:hypothetical protein